MNPLLGLTGSGSQSGSGQTRSMLTGAKRKQKNQKVWLCGSAPEIQEVEE
ncbi:hypothetical protein HanRHA438_Chr03g0122421 [Helianthus annuus]|nr:hypothetical protein HanRHA438_Chr03g0122421 [Helianthus annuus]